MGGPGSGSNYHWWRAGKKTVVEHCRELDANRWMRDGILAAGVHKSGSCAWRTGSGAESSIGFEVCTLDPANPWLRLHYAFTDTGKNEDYRIELEATRPRFGGLRWWFLCPLVVSGMPCGRRVGKLYPPPTGRYFGCRHCHDLTYRSAQEHDKRVDLFRRNPAALQAAMNGDAPLPLLMLALKASTRMLEDERKWERRYGK